MILHKTEAIKDYTEEGLWGNQTIDDIFRRNLARYPDELAIADAPNRHEFAGGEVRRLSYRQLNNAVDAMAVVLQQQGIGNDAIVLVQMPNIVEMFVTYLACARLGAIISPVPVQYAAHELKSILETLQTTSVMVINGRFKEEDFSARVRASLNTLNANLPLLVFGETPELQTLFDGNAPPVTSPVERSANDIYTICWTSGTVATPKGVPLSHNNWLLYASAVAEAGNAREREHFLNPFPCVNLSGLGISLMAWLYCAGTVFLHHPFDAEVFLRQLQEEKIGYTVAAPAVLNSLLTNDELLERFDIRSVHTVMSGSAALSPVMISEFKRRFAIDIINGFGANEGVTLTSSAREVPDPARRAEYFPRIGSAAYSPRLNYHHWVKTKLINPESGEEIRETGVPGELLIHSGVVFPGYYNRPDLTREAFDDEGYFRSGDLFEIAADDQGNPVYYRFVGRLKNLVVRGGMKIAPEELVALINQHPAVLESEVVGYPDEILGERVCACVVLRSGQSLSKEGLISFLSDKGLAKFKWVEYLFKVEQLPRNPIGKVDRQQLLAAVLSGEYDEL